MEFLKILTIASISLLAAMSPGPDFAMVTKNSMLGSFRSGFLTALGVGAALLVHVTYCVFGIAILLYESPYLFYIIKYLGALYLFYLGICLFREKIDPETNKIEGKPLRQHSFVSGFLCNLLNPKATLFILSLFTQFIDPSMVFSEKMILGSVIAIVTFLWFVLLSYIISHRFVQKHFIRFQIIISRVMGASLCMLGFYIAIQK